MAELMTRKRAIELNPRRRMKSGGLRAKAWWVLRNRKTATIETLLNTLGDANQKDAESNLRKYLAALVKAGILRTEAQRVPGKALTSNGFKKYVLVIDCGPDAPLYRVKLGHVFAPSISKSFPIGGDA